MSSLKKMNGITADSKYEDRYSVYTFTCSNDNKGPVCEMDKLYANNVQYHCTWNKYKSYDDRFSAFCMAKELYESGDYDYVEIKKRSFNKRTKQSGDQTIAVIGNKKGGEDRSTMMSFSLAILCGAAAILGCAFFLKHMMM